MEESRSGRQVEFPAHIRREADGSAVEQSVREHCENTAEYARQCLESVGLGEAAYFAGMMHDLGKCRKRFADYIRDSFAGKKRDEVVVHTFQAVRCILESYHMAVMPDGSGKIDEKEEERRSSLYGKCRSLQVEMLAYACGAHHGQFDIIAGSRSDSGSESASGEMSEYGFLHRLGDTDFFGQDVEYRECLDGYERTCLDCGERDRLLKVAVGEITRAIANVKGLMKSADAESRKKGGSDRSVILKNRRRDYFYYGYLMTRLIESAVIEGDRRDTCEFCGNLSLPEINPDREGMWLSCLGFIDSKMAGFSDDGAVNAARSAMSGMCLRSGFRDNGRICRLSIPTGSGKTLSSLRYAFAQAYAHRRKRIFYVTNLLAVIDQNGKEIRNAVPDFVEVIEHHSNVIVSSGRADGLKWERLCEDWSAPFTITTMVQFMNTLFSGGNSCVRRMHALCDSVIIIDEVQSVPPRMLTLFNLAMNFLAYACNATVVLCSATQPYLEGADNPLLGRPAEIVPYDAVLMEPFRRTRIVVEPPMALPSVPSWLFSLIGSGTEDTSGILVICNTKEEAKFIYSSLKARRGIGELFHLSGSMCKVHRESVISRLRQRLGERHDRIICVSTQLMEAGVDISFTCVIRLAAGIDSVIQSAGRCNRHGEMSGLGNVHVIEVEQENLEGLSDIRTAKDKFVEMFPGRDSGAYEIRDGADEIGEYYRRYYGSMNDGDQDFPLKDGNSIYDMLSLNERLPDLPRSKRRFSLGHRYRTAGDLFSLFDDSAVDVIVRYDRRIVDGLISRLSSLDWDSDRKECMRAMRELGGYCVPVRQGHLSQLRELGAIGEICEGHAYVLNDGFYDSETGAPLPQGGRGKN